MNYKLVLTPRAKMDRDRAFDWYNTNYSKEFAARWYDGISLTLKSLTVDPMLCHKAHENDRFPFEVYEILHGRRINKHRILFTIDNDSVIVLHIRHSAQRDLTADDL